MVDEYYRNERPTVRALLLDEGPILDVGCGAGLLCAPLAARGVEIVGIEMNPEAARAARGRYGAVHEGLYQTFIPESRFRQIVFADVLEHMEDPWGALRRAVDELLAPGGRVVISMPNIRYWQVIFDLVIRGRWRYVDSGILDRTHLRFFTRSSLVELVQGSGLRIELLRPNYVHPIFRIAGEGTLGLLRPFCALQWLVVARR